MKILVIGGTGKVGSSVVKELSKRGADLRLLVRKKDTAVPAQPGAETAVGDLLDPVSIEKALDGVDKLYLLNAVVPDELTQAMIAYDLSGPKVASIWSGLLGREIKYPDADMDAFEKQMRAKVPAWSAFDLRMMFQGYLERGFAADSGDIEALSALLGHPPRRYEDFAAETALTWQKV